MATEYTWKCNNWRGDEYMSASDEELGSLAKLEGAPPPREGDLREWSQIGNIIYTTGGVGVPENEKKKVSCFKIRTTATAQAAANANTNTMVAISTATATSAIQLGMPSVPLSVRSGTDAGGYVSLSPVQAVSAGLVVLILGFGMGLRAKKIYDCMRCGCGTRQRQRERNGNGKALTEAHVRCRRD